MRYGGAKRRRMITTATMIHAVLIVCGLVAGIGLLVLTLRSLEPSEMKINIRLNSGENLDSGLDFGSESGSEFVNKSGGNGSCATVEEMGKAFGDGYVVENLRIRRLIRNHFDAYGTLFDFIHFLWICFHFCLRQCFSFEFCMRK